MLNERWPNTEPDTLLSRPGPGPGPGPSEKGTLYQNSLFELKTLFDKFEGADFKYDNTSLKF